MSTSTPTEISSNPNSSCRLLVCLNSLPFHDQRVFRSLLGHTELVRLSACCRSLRSSIRNDTVLWQALYHRAFLSGAYYAKEMDFILWCIRTDVNNPCTSDKRADLLENVDWYNTYRRRVSTENNWRYGRCNTTRIDMEQGKDGIRYITETGYNSSTIVFQTRPDVTSKSHRYHALEHLPHSNLRSSNSIVHNSTLSTSPNAILLDSGTDGQYDCATGDHYIAVFPYTIESDTNYNVKILTRKHGGVFTTFDVPIPYKVMAVKGKWVLLVHGIRETYTLSSTFNVMVFDIDNSIMCPGSIDDTWNAVHFCETTNHTAIVYTTRVVGYRMDRVEWALYQFSGNNPAVQLRNGWFQLPKGTPTVSIFVRDLYDSNMLIKLPGNYYYDSHIIHSVASNGQSHTPRNSYAISDQHIPTPLLKAGCDYLALNPKPAKVWTDLSYNDDQVLQIPGTFCIRHIIGDLYFFLREHNDIGSRLLVDINTKEIIRKLEAPNGKGWRFSDYAMVGTAYNFFDGNVLAIQEYGEL